MRKNLTAQKSHMFNITQSGYQYQRFSEENANQLAMTTVAMTHNHNPSYHSCPQQSYPSLSTIIRVQPMYYNIHTNEQTVRPSTSIHEWTITSTQLLSIGTSVPTQSILTATLYTSRTWQYQRRSPSDLNITNLAHTLDNTHDHYKIAKWENEIYIVYITSEMLTTHNTSFKYISSSL